MNYRKYFEALGKVWFSVVIHASPVQPATRSKSTNKYYENEKNRKFCDYEHPIPIRWE